MLDGCHRNYVCPVSSKSGHLSSGLCDAKLWAHFNISPLDTGGVLEWIITECGPLHMCVSTNYVSVYTCGLYTRSESHDWRGKGEGFWSLPVLSFGLPAQLTSSHEQQGLTNLSY